MYEALGELQYHFVGNPYLSPKKCVKQLWSPTKHYGMLAILSDAHYYRCIKLMLQYIPRNMLNGHAVLQPASAN